MLWKFQQIVLHIITFLYSYNDKNLAISI